MVQAIARRTSGRWPLSAWPAIALMVTVAAGLPVESAAYPGDPAAAAGDLAVAVAFVVCGSALWSRARSGDLSGALMVGTGVTWLIGGLADELALLHRGPLVHLLVTWPAGRPKTPVEWVVVIAGYGLAVVPEVARDESVTVALAVALASAAAGRCLRAGGLQRRARTAPAAAAVAIALVLVAGVLAAPVDAHSVLWLYEGVLVATAFVLVADQRWGSWARAAVTGLVIDLGDRRSGSLAGVLAHAVGDPSLVVGYSLGEGRYADERGRPVLLPEPDAGRAVTTVETDGAPAAVLVHDPAALRSPELSDAVAAAVHVALDNVRLQADIRAHVREVEASRRRLLRARESERRRLQRRLSASVGRRLDSATRALADLEGNPDELLAALPGELARTRAEVRRFAMGLHPPDLETGGLAAAVPALAARAPIPVEVSVGCGRLEGSLEATAWFVCSEGLANVVKHAGAATAAIRVEATPGGVVVTVDDDGRGGADLSGGRGLRGLAARVEAVGGRLDVRARPDGGTRLCATLTAEVHV
jgi:signal transduction histidine kinase